MVVVRTAVMSFRVGSENCTLLGYYAVGSGNSLLTFWNMNHAGWFFYLWEGMHNLKTLCKESSIAFDDAYKYFKGYMPPLHPCIWIVREIL
jgi:hypothetical protein